MKIISVEDLTYQYPTQKRDEYALNHVNFDVSEGECVAFQGPTGAGKSTLCMTLNGIVPHVFRGRLEGKVIINGIDTLSTSVASLAQVTGLMFQDPETQFVGMTVEEELFFGAGNYGIPRDIIKERSHWALNLLRLNEYEQREPSTLSGGEKQRVALASILVMRSKILVLDEPTSELDPLGASEVYEALHTLKNELGITLIITSHHSEMLPGLVDRIMIMNEGRMIIEGAPKDVYQHSKKISEVGVRPPQVVQFWNGLIDNGIIPSGLAPVTLDEATNLFREFIIKKQIRIEKINEHKINSEDQAEELNTIPKPVIEVKELYYSYPSGSQVINNLSLTIRAGEYVAIIGQNGAGKTTLVKHFNGLLKPSKGAVLVFGKNTKDVLTTNLAHRVGYAFQNPDHQIFRPTVWDEVAFGPQNLLFDRKDLEKSVIHALELVGLENEKDTYPFNLGKGQRQKLALASVIAMETEVIIIDEPTTGLDWKASDEVLKLLQILNEAGRTIIVITHNIELVSDHVPRTIVLHQGSVLLEGKTFEVISKEEELRKTYVKPPQITLFANRFITEGFPSNITTIRDALNVVHKRHG